MKLQRAIYSPAKAIHVHRWWKWIMICSRAVDELISSLVDEVKIHKLGECSRNKKVFILLPFFLRSSFLIVFRTFNNGIPPSSEWRLISGLPTPDFLPDFPTSRLSDFRTFINFSKMCEIFRRIKIIPIFDLRKTSYICKKQHLHSLPS